MGGGAPFIAARRVRVYPSVVTAALFRLLAIAAMLLMPFGMGLAPAAASSGHKMSMAPSGHCDQAPASKSNKAKLPMSCAAACTALPATPASIPLPDQLPPIANWSVNPPALSGTAPPPATPPPRLG